MHYNQHTANNNLIGIALCYQDCRLCSKIHWCHLRQLVEHKVVTSKHIEMLHNLQGSSYMLGFNISYT